MSLLDLNPEDFTDTVNLSNSPAVIDSHEVGHQNKRVCEHTGKELEERAEEVQMAG